ncbi:hypothetical protein TA3x_004362 [Tundrisphaera sp. TA3]|uniref:hypothetical protein n=1 Tax=Tundrisphaera sp. TA3 TaxID=3435775 RepID=UPI003EBB3483
MKPLEQWLGRVVVAGICASFIGCGGSDVPDPDSDSSAVADTPVQIVDQGAAPGAAPAPAEAAPAAEAETAPGAAAPAATPDPAAVAATPDPAPAPAGEEAAAPAAPALKGDASGTDELARMVAAPPAPTEAAPDPAATPGAPGAADPTMAMAGSPTGALPPVEGSIPGDPSMTVPGAPGAEIPGSGGDNGDGIGANEPADFSGPWSGAVAFLSALKAKDKDRLAQAVARRAPTEAAEKYRKIFLSISDVSISDEELDEMAKAFEGYKPVQQMPAVSSGRIDIVLGNNTGPDYRQRKVTMRKEKEGWKLLDIGKIFEFKRPKMPSRRR